MKKLKIIVDDMSIKGGVESVVASIANGLSKKNIDVTIVTIYDCKYSYPISDKIKTISLSSKKSKRSKYYSLYNYIKYNTTENDIIYTNSVANSVCSLLASKYKKNIYSCDHNKYDAVNLVWRILRSIFYKKAGGIIVLTNYDLRKYKKINSNSRVFENPVNDTFFREDYNSLSEYKQHKYILNIGRLEWQKGQDMLLRAWKNVDNKDYELWICGDGSQEQNLKNLVCTLGITQTVRFLGSRSDIPTLLKNAYCNVLSSRFEGKPVSLLEAKVMGCPSISFNCKTGPSEIINNNIDGILVETNNIQELALSIQKMIDNPSYRDNLSHNAIINKDIYSINSVTDSYIDFMNLSSSR